MSRRSLLEPALLGSRPELVRRVERVLSIENPQRHVSVHALGAALCGIAACSLQLQSVGTFSEIGDTVFPQVRSEAARADMAGMVPAEGMFAGIVARRDSGNVKVSRRVDDRRGESPQLDGFSVPAGTGEAPTPVVPNPAAAPADALASVEIAGRTFAGAYPLRDTAPSLAPSGSVPWKALAAPGLEIASAAKKTSIGVATAFSRAGVSIARSF